MPSPFPGMDPYLEHPAYWPGVHQRLLTRIADRLNQVLPEPYVADLGERVYVSASERSIYPDILVTQAGETDARGSSTAVLARPATERSTSTAPWLVEATGDEVREVFVEVRLPARNDELVTVIELLSPANKTVGDTGRLSYLRKQAELLASAASLMEIDLLRSGEHTVAPDREALRECGQWDYLVSLHRAETRYRFEVWPIRLAEPLPTVQVPLAHGEGHVDLNLQALFTECYEAGPYRRRIDYRQDPVPSLPAEQAAWARKLLDTAAR